MAHGVSAVAPTAKAAAQADSVLKSAKVDAFFLPSWNDKYGRAIRNAPTAVLLDVRNRAVKGLPYGDTEPRVLRALVPLMEEELRGRGEPIAIEATNKQKAKERDSQKRWWQSKSDSRSKRLADAL